ncbi:MAG: DUF4268 domain-containing protein [Candidatus Halichondribacter symbioticus]
MTSSFSKSKVISLRVAFGKKGEKFGKEDKDFTPWLCKDDNLNYYLGEVLGMTLEEPQKESKVGRALSLDILCKNKKDKSLVAIENQFGIADHKHLGQIMTYGAGLKAPTMIWIAEDFTEEHLTALKWLNKHTDKKFRFFGVKVEARKIGGSNTAIDFSVVSHPSDWRKPKSRGVHKKIKKNLTPMEDLKKRYWQGLEKYMADNDSKLTGQTPGPWQEQYFKIGRADTGIIVRLHIRENKVRIEIKLFAKKSSKAFFNLLYKDKEAIEKKFKLDSGLDWQEFPKLGHSSIGVNLNNMNIKDEKDWNKQYANIKFGIERFDKVFTHRILALDLSDWNPPAPK